MAWLCPRCEKKIFAPREGAVRFAFVWKYVKKNGELLIDLKNLDDIKDNAVVTHLQCPSPETDGFHGRIKSALGMPANKDHPLLI